MSVPNHQKLEEGIYNALLTYSNVHRGSGFKSAVTTQLYEEARNIILDHLKLSRKRYTVIFCTPGGAAKFISTLKKPDYRVVSSADMGLAIGVRAVAVRINALPKGNPYQAGGGNTKLTGPDWIVWAGTPDRFEAGTPAIINIITLARACLLMDDTSGRTDTNHSDRDGLAALLNPDVTGDRQGKKLLEYLREHIIGRAVTVPTAFGPSPFINFDSSASTPALKQSWETYRQALCLNPGDGTKLVEHVRKIVAGFVRAPLTEYDILFTSNTTESVNLLADYYGRHRKGPEHPMIASTYLEHSSNDLPFRLYENLDMVRIRVDNEGFLDMEHMQELFESYNRKKEHGDQRIVLAAVSGASNVLGTCNDLATISRAAHQYDIHLLIDGAQLVPHKPVDMKGSDIDFLAFSAHKLYAPFGCGVLVARKGLISPEAQGSMFKKGEENVAGIAAMGTALSLLQRVGMEVIRDEEHRLTKAALNALSGIKGIKLFGLQDTGAGRFHQKLGVIPFSMKGRMPKKVARLLAEEGGIGVRHGCHCAHIIVKQILGVGPGPAQIQRIIQVLIPAFRTVGVVRVSLGIENSEKDIEALSGVLKNIAPDSAKGKLRNGKMNERLTGKEMKKAWDTEILRITEAVYEVS